MTAQQKSIIKQGEKVYGEIKSRLKKRYSPSDYVTIEPVSKKFFVGKTPAEAIDKARKNFPQKQFFMAQVGRVAGVLYFVRL